MCDTLEVDKIDFDLAVLMGDVTVISVLEYQSAQHVSCAYISKSWDKQCHQLLAGFFGLQV